jgi:hypothetical protein
VRRAAGGLNPPGVAPTTPIHPTVRKRDGIAPPITCGGCGFRCTPPIRPAARRCAAVRGGPEPAAGGAAPPRGSRPTHHSPPGGGRARHGQLCRILIAFALLRCSSSRSRRQLSNCCAEAFGYNNHCRQRGRDEPGINGPAFRKLERGLGRRGRLSQRSLGRRSMGNKPLDKLQHSRWWNGE